MLGQSTDFVRSSARGAQRPRGFGRITFDILRLLWDGPRDAGELVATLADRHVRHARPQSLYPALQTLEAGEFVTARLVGGKRVYTIARAGSELLAALSEM